MTKQPGSRRAVPRRISPAERSEEPVVVTENLLPLAAIALRLLEEGERGDIVYIAADERRAEEIGRILGKLSPSRDVVVFPPWDCLPFDRASPSRDSMGRRIKAMQRLARKGDRRIVVITTIEAALQRTPPSDRVIGAEFTCVSGESLDLDALRSFAGRVGYRVAERVDEPGDIDFHGQVVEIYPPGEEEPVRIEIADGRAVGVHRFDPVSQRSTDEVARVVVGPASELIPSAESPIEEPTAGAERLLASFYGDPLPSLFDLIPNALLFTAPGTADRQTAFVEQLEESAAMASATEPGSRGRSQAIDWRRLYLDQDGWQAVLDRHEEGDVTSPRFAPVPRFSDAAKPAHAFQMFLEEECTHDRRVVLAGVPRDLAAFGRHLARHGGRLPNPAADWDEVTSAAPGAFLSLELDLDEGIADRERGITLVAAADVLGTRAHHEADPRAAAALVGQPGMKIGDMVIHEDHGVGILRGLETVDVGGTPHDAVRLEYHGEASLLVPAEDLDRVWRYGSDEEAVGLDRLHTAAWSKRRIEIERAVLDTARHLVALAEERNARSAPKLVAPEKLLAKFTARFPYPLTPDQARAVAAVTDDLGSGRPMDRLVCGDVGFGKTEVALRAAAVALMAGKQVALVAPTTVLARQHLELFRKRFAGFGFEIAGLSRLEASSEARRVRDGLAEGSIQMVIGTHAVAAASTEFHDLGLLMIDEEQKFGANLKASLRGLAAGGHVLTLTATPIPRTLQMALVGVQTVSVIATPPVRRRPIRTFVTAFDPGAARLALMREHARGGQSFAIVPRIEDIAALQARLAEIVPELQVLVAHGGLPAEEADRAMVSFAHGHGDILLATDIVESGLDVPHANTMLVWGAGRFGLSQLHQLRGRVGRGRAQGVAYLLSDPEAPLSERTRQRLATLQTFDRLGAGFAISARDLDLRGAGDLVGDEQAGHLRLIGLELYQSLLGRAVQLAKGEKLDDAAPPEVKLDLIGRIPESYVAEPDLRIELYSRLSRLTTGRAIRAFHAEIEDRFGNPPPEVETLLGRARLRVACRHLKAASLSVGPRGVAITVRPDGAEACRKLAGTRSDLVMNGPRLVWSSPGTEGADDPLARAESFLDMFEAVTGR